MKSWDQMTKIFTIKMGDKELPNETWENNNERWGQGCPGTKIDKSPAKCASSRTGWHQEKKKKERKDAS